MIIRGFSLYYIPSPVSGLWKRCKNPIQARREYRGYKNAFKEVIAIPTEITDEYDTKTRGRRQVQPVRALGEGIYEIVSHASDRQTHTHVVYKLELPSPGREGEPQGSLNINREASFIIQIKNPEQPDSAQLLLQMNNLVL